MYGRGEAFERRRGRRDSLEKEVSMTAQHDVLLCITVAHGSFFLVGRYHVVFGRVKDKDDELWFSML